MPGSSARDVEFVQFHPSVLWVGPDSRGQQALVSEAVRGEGAVLYDGLGRRIMEGVHPLEDLAPRDVVASAISRRMAEAPGGVGDHVFLDATHLGEEFYERFPSITESCRAVGVDPARERIPVAPAAHYACGGVPADLDGVTEMPGLYAIGEVTCTGVHGANRLASNSVTEGIVAGTRVGHRLRSELPERVEVGADAGRSYDAPLRNPAQRVEMRSVMSSQVGVLRTPSGLEGALRQLQALASTSSVGVTGSRAAWEATNMLTIAAAVALGASARTESRGCHRRDDHPEPRTGVAHPPRCPDDDRRWSGADRHPAPVSDRASPTRTAMRSANRTHDRTERPPSGTLLVMFTFHPLSDRHTAAGSWPQALDPDAIAALVRMAVPEDLMGGIDVTSTATIPADHRSTATFGARGARRRVAACRWRRRRSTPCAARSPATSSTWSTTVPASSRVSSRSRHRSDAVCS